MTIDYQIKYLDDLAEKNHDLNLSWDMRDAIRAGRDALREQQERENPQPLTLEELREMDGEPVWVEAQSCKWWEIVYSEGDVLITDTDHYLYLDSYGIDWIAYRYPPKED